MAVSVQAPLYSKLGMWVMGDPPTAFSSPDPDALSTMAYQYPLGNSGLESSSNMIPSYHHLPEEHGQSNSPADVTPLSPSFKNRGTSNSSKSAKIKRSMSTPNVRGQSSADAALALSAEKRRNKLGYHRTSVACGKNMFIFELAVRFPRRRRLTDLRTLSTEKDQVYSCTGRPTESVFELHQIEKGMQLLPC